jgi:hypothetical protein
MRSLRCCQAIWKRKLILKKLSRITPFIVEIYYSPGGRGEFLAKREFYAKSYRKENT